MDTLILSEVTPDGELLNIILHMAARWGTPHQKIRTLRFSLSLKPAATQISLLTRFQGEGCAARASFPLQTGRLKRRKLRWSDEGLSLLPFREEGVDGARLRAPIGGVQFARQIVPSVWGLGCRSACFSGAQVR